MTCDRQIHCGELGLAELLVASTQGNVHTRSVTGGQWNRPCCKTDPFPAVPASPWGMVPSPGAHCQAHGCVDRLSRPESCMHSGVLEHLQAQRNASAHIYAHINSNFISVKPEREHWREEEKGGRETNAEGGLGAPPFALTGEINHCNYGPAQVNGDRSALSFPSSRCFLLIWASQALMPTDPWLMTKI